MHALNIYGVNLVNFLVVEYVGLVFILVAGSGFHLCNFI